MTSDIPALLEEIRAEVERKRQAGEYPPEVLAEIERPSEAADPLDDVSLDDVAGDDLTSALAELTRSGYFTARITTDSKKPFIGPAVALSRRMIRAGLSWYMNGVLQQVRKFAGNVDRSMAILARRTRALAARVDALEQEVAELRGRIERLDR